MGLNLTITPQNEYIDVKVSGIATYASAIHLWQSIAQTCEEQQCFKVLGEQSVKNSLSTMEAWNHQKIFEEAGITSKFKIAWVDTNPHTYDTTNFIRTVLRNRDIAYGKLFSDITIAKDWLLDISKQN